MMNKIAVMDEARKKIAATIQDQIGPDCGNEKNPEALASEIVEFFKPAMDQLEEYVRAEYEVADMRARKIAADLPGMGTIFGDPAGRNVERVLVSLLGFWKTSMSVRCLEEALGLDVDPGLFDPAARRQRILDAIETRETRGADLARLSDELKIERGKSERRRQQVECLQTELDVLKTRIQFAVSALDGGTFR